MALEARGVSADGKASHTGLSVYDRIISCLPNCAPQFVSVGRANGVPAIGHTDSPIRADISVSQSLGHLIHRHRRERMRAIINLGLSDYTISPHSAKTSRDRRRVFHRFWETEFVSFCFLSRFPWRRPFVPRYLLVFANPRVISNLLLFQVFFFFF